MYASLESPESLFATVALFKKTNVPLMIPCLKKRYGLFFWKCKHKFLNTDVPFPLKQNLWPFFLYSELFHKTNLRAYFAFSTRLITPDQCKECIHVFFCIEFDFESNQSSIMFTHPECNKLNQATFSSKVTREKGWTNQIQVYLFSSPSYTDHEN